MQSVSTHRFRPSTTGMRLLLLVASGLVFTVGITLNLLPERTDRFFAWTISPPLTAAFLGAGYWASFILEYLASREGLWARGRIAVPAVLVFTTLTLIATLLHIDRFHLGAKFPVFTQIGTWVWLAVYALVPPLMLVLWLLQLRVRGDDPPRQAPIHGWMRALIGLQAGVMLALGLGLFLAPLTIGTIWPWKLTALTGRAIGAWLLGLGVGAAQVVWENDWWRVPAAAAGYTVFAVLELLAVLRFGAAIDWGKVGGWLYLLFLLSVLFVGIYGWREVRQANMRMAQE